MAGKQVKLLFLLVVFISSLVFNVLAIPSTFQELAIRGPYIGLISASGKQGDAFFATGAFKPDARIPYVDLAGKRFHMGTIGTNSVIYVTCGAGLVNAASTTQLLLDAFPRTRAVIHFGTSGNADNSLSIGDVVIPKQFSQTGLWDWEKPKVKPIPANDVAELEFGRFHVPSGGYNQLGSVMYSTEDFYSKSGKPDTPQKKLWFETSEDLLQMASNLKVELNHCVDKVCLIQKPKLVVGGVNGTTANFYVDNPAYRDFLHKTFHVSTIDMESAAVFMTSLSNGYHPIAIRGVSNSAGAEQGANLSAKFGPLARENVAKTVVALVNRFPSPRF